MYLAAILGQVMGTILNLTHMNNIILYELCLLYTTFKIIFHLFILNIYFMF